MPTKTNKSLHVPRFKALAIEQENAIDLLITDQTDGEVAAAIGVNRGTVWEWRHEHPVFQAELNRRRQELFAAPQQRLRALAAKAVENVAAAVEAGDLRTSLEVIKGLGLYGAGAFTGATDPETLLQAQAEAALAQEEAPLDPMRALLADPEVRWQRERRAEIVEALRRDYCA
jgi:Helix-turn-helix of insertion element transposase